MQLLGLMGTYSDILVCAGSAQTQLMTTQMAAPQGCGFCLVVRDMDRSWVDKVPLETAASSRGICPTGVEVSFLSGVDAG